VCYFSIKGVFILDSDILAYIRKVIDDEDSGNYTFSDEFIESVYTSKDENTNKTISELFLILAGKVLKSGVTSYTIGNESYTLYDAYNKYIELSEIWGKKSSDNNVGSLFQNDINKDTTEEVTEYSSYSNVMGGYYSDE
jgi:hypothetical protein